MAMLEELKVFLGISESENDRNTESRLMLLLSFAEREVKEYCGISEINGLENIIVEIAAIKYNRGGSEGVASESYSGASYSYLEDYPPHIKRQLSRRKMARFF